MSGADWDRLTGLVAVQPSLMLVPSRLWTDMSTRLLEELIASTGQAWMQRSEALHRLLGHPVGQSAAIAACTDLVADSASQIFVEPMAVLDASAHPDASRHVLNQLTRPLNARSQYGALLACVRKLRDGHFTAEQQRRSWPPCCRNSCARRTPTRGPAPSSSNWSAGCRARCAPRPTGGCRGVWPRDRAGPSRRGWPPSRW